MLDKQEKYALQKALNDAKQVITHLGYNCFASAKVSAVAVIETLQTVILSAELSGDDIFSPEKTDSNSVLTETNCSDEIY